MRIEADRHPRRHDRIALVSSYTAKDVIRRVPGARWSKDDNAWSVPLAWTSCLALRDLFGSDLVVGDELTKWAWDVKIDLIDPAMALRESLGADIPGDPRLYEFQRAGVAFLRLVRRGLLCDEMGAGKTVQAILALAGMRASGELVGPTLVVCPNTMKSTWAREIFMWDPDADYEVIRGTAEQRRRQIARGKDRDYLIINWEALRSHSRLTAFGSTALRKCIECGGTGTVRVAQCEVHEREFNMIDFGAVIADEAHRAKDPQSLQTRALWGASGETEIRFAMTGTPIANDPTELWPLLHWVDEQEWPAKTAWVERLVDYTYNIFGGREINGIKPTHEKEFHATVDPRMRRMPKSVVLPFLPPIVIERRDVDLSKQQQRAYDEMRTRMIAELDSGMLLAANPMVQVGRLMQLASANGDIVVGADGEERLVLGDPSSKLDALIGDLKDFEGQSVIVFAESRQIIEMLSERMTRVGIRHGMITGRIPEDVRDRTITDFQADRFQYVLCTIKAGGVGITLTQASVVVCLQRNWSSVEMKQAISRAHRIGSEIHDSITVIDYVAPGTVEEVQIAALAKKDNMLEEIVRDADLLRRLLLGEPLE